MSTSREPKECKYSLGSTVERPENLRKRTGTSTEGTLPLRRHQYDWSRDSDHECFSRRLFGRSRLDLRWGVDPTHPNPNPNPYAGRGPNPRPVGPKRGCAAFWTIFCDPADHARPRETVMFGQAYSPEISRTFLPTKW